MGPHNKDKDYSRLGSILDSPNLEKFPELPPYTCEVVFLAQQRRIAWTIPSFIKPASLNPIFQISFQILIPNSNTPFVPMAHDWAAGSCCSQQRLSFYGLLGGSWVAISRVITMFQVRQEPIISCSSVGSFRP